MQKTVWQNATCTAFYRKNMTEEVTGLSPEPVTGFILSRKWFRLSDLSSAEVRTTKRPQSAP